jgi:hypothetical protein
MVVEMMARRMPSRNAAPNSVPFPYNPRCRPPVIIVPPNASVHANRPFAAPAKGPSVGSLGLIGRNVGGRRRALAGRFRVVGKWEVEGVTSHEDDPPRFSRDPLPGANPIAIEVQENLHFFDPDGWR